MIHTIQKPQFEPKALEPYFDSATMDLHVNKHHQTYADKLNAALENTPELQSKTLEELASLGTKDQVLITNMAGGVLNHNFFWTILSPNFDQPPPNWFTTNLKTEFTAQASSLFGSGWTWLVSNSSQLEIINTPNQDSPLAQNKIPMLALDLWEHSYYLKYQNRRPEYIDAFWHVVNWQQVDSIYQSLTSNR